MQICIRVVQRSPGPSKDLKDPHSDSFHASAVEKTCPSPEEGQLVKDKAGVVGVEK